MAQQWQEANIFTPELPPPHVHTIPFQVDMAFSDHSPNDCYNIWSNNAFLNNYFYLDWEYGWPWSDLILWNYKIKIKMKWINKQLLVAWLKCSLCTLQLFSSGPSWHTVWLQQWVVILTRTFGLNKESKQKAFHIYFIKGAAVTSPKGFRVSLMDLLMSVVTYAY